MTTPDLKTISIIGGGFVGASMACLLARELETRFEEAARNSIATPRLKIAVFDPAQALGKGIPYARYSHTAEDNAVAKNNQPNNRMSFDPKNIESFAQYVNPEDPKSVNDKFESRIKSGDYANNSFEQTKNNLKNSALPIETQHHRLKVLDIERIEQYFSIRTNDGNTFKSDYVIVADGHQYRDDLESLYNSSAFFGRYTDTGIVRQHLSGTTGPVAIRGTSQSMVDWLRVLDHIGYQGKIFAFSQNNNMPWAFDPKEHPVENDLREYQMDFLGSGYSVSRLNTLDLETLTSRFEEEKKRALKHGIGPAILLSRAVNLLAPKRQEASDALNAFFNRLTEQYGNPTPQFNMDLIRKFTEKDQLKTVKARINANNVQKTRRGLTLTDHNLKITALFDAAMFARSAFRENGTAISPLLENMRKHDMLKVNAEQPDIFVEGQQNLDNLYLAKGPATSRWKWGIEAFRGQNQEIVEEIANQLNPIRQ